MSVKSQIKEKWLLYRLEVKKDPEAFGELYDLYAPRIYRFIYFKISSGPDAEDITAEVFLKVWEHIRNGREVRKFAGLLYKVARNKVIDFYRDRKVKVEALDENMLEQLSDLGAVQKNLEARDELQNLIKSLRLLKDEYREAITLRFIDGLSIGEIAEILNKTQINTRVLLHRAQKTLKKILAAQEQK